MIKRHKLPVIKSMSWDAIYIIENRVNNIVITLYGGRG